MQGTATTLVTLGGLFLSLACAVFVEELLLGGLFRLFFAPRPETGARTHSRFRGWQGGAAGEKRGSEQVR